MVSTSEHAALAGEPAHQQRAEAAGLRPDPPALDRAECGRRRPQGSPGEDVEGEPACERNVFTHVPTGPTCEVCKLAKTTQAPCKNRLDA